MQAAFVGREFPSFNLNQLVVKRERNTSVSNGRQTGNVHDISHEIFYTSHDLNRPPPGWTSPSSGKCTAHGSILFRPWTNSAINKEKGRAQGEQAGAHKKNIEVLNSARFNFHQCALLLVPGMLYGDHEPSEDTTNHTYHGIIQFFSPHLCTHKIIAGRLLW